MTITSIALLVTTPVIAQETLTCTDRDANGFSWKSGAPQRASFETTQFTVQVLSQTKRMIKYSGYSGSVPYVCFSPTREPDLSLCTSTLAAAVEPIIFRGNKFERVANFAKHVNEQGKAMGLAVAYGTCVKQ